MVCRVKLVTGGRQRLVVERLIHAFRVIEQFKRHMQHTMETQYSAELHARQLGELYSLLQPENKVDSVKNWELIGF